MCLELLSLVIALSCLFKEALVSSHLLHKKKRGGGQMANLLQKIKEEIGIDLRKPLLRKKKLKAPLLQRVRGIF